MGATTNPMDLTGRSILVTGATSGIGRETAILLSRLGARLALVARDRGRLDGVAEGLEGSGHLVEPIDLSDTETIAARVKEIGKRAGGLHGLVHAAGVHSMQPLRTLEPADLDLVMRVNVSSAVQLARGFRHKETVAAPAGVVFLASVVAQVGQPMVSAYAASKGAIVALTKSLALELAREGIRVNCVAPSLVRTAMTEKILRDLDGPQIASIESMHPLGIGEPRDVANAIAFLLADTGRWITGTTLAVDGGYTAQ
jgi:3-oxoacyl-[acyl-carrier protein] reductase